ncbi:MAG: hypothetical protein MPJ50_16380 [Pirellulales bacterium]|nr:hypothetical protein [Pirellulales bacterium]
MTISRTKHQQNSKLPKLPATIDYRLMVQFEDLRKKFLAQEELAPRLGKALAYWTLPTDRLLPLFFMQRTLREILNTPFEELCQAPGIGNKKIATLLNLLQRAASPDAESNGLQSDDTPRTEAEAALEELAAGFNAVSCDYDVALRDRPISQDPDHDSCFITEQGGRRIFHTVNMDILPDGFDPAKVSETVWARWRQIVGQFGFQDEYLGRFARNLQDMPRVIWQLPFKNYLDASLSEIRSMRTHGEKRVRVIIETFAGLQAMLSTQSMALRQAPQPIAVRIVPRFVYPIEDWLTRLLHWRRLVPYERIRRCFVTPILDQLQIDAGDNVIDVVRRRLNLEGAQIPVRNMANELGVTRARVYQLLGEVNEVMRIRWPEGAWLVQQARERIEDLTIGERDEDRRAAAHLFIEMAELCFPTRTEEECRAEEDGDALGNRNGMPPTARANADWDDGERL